MESTLSAFKRPIRNNALPLRELHQEKKEKKPMVNGIRKRYHWTHSEDLKLIELVEVFGPRDWNFIAEKMQTRSGKSCRLRWLNQLDPNLNHSAFTEEEEELLLTAHKYYGNQWSKIAKMFNGRTDSAVTNHCNILKKRILRRQTASNLRCFADVLNRHTSNLVPGSVSDEGTEIKNNSLDMSNEETTNLNAQGLQEENYSSGMPVQLSGHHHFCTFTADSYALLTHHVSVTQPSSLSSPEAADTVTTKEPPRFIDFLGVGDS